MRMALLRHYRTTKDRIVRINTKTSKLRSLSCGRGAGDGQFAAPMGIAVRGDQLFVADNENKRVQVIDAFMDA